MTAQRTDRHRARLVATGGGLIAGYLLDRIVGDPVRAHPVAAFGRAAGALERHVYRDSHWAGAVFVAVSVGGVAGAAIGLRRATDAAGVAGLVATAITTWAAFGGTSLTRVADDLGAALAAGDVAGARELIPSLCGRDPDALDEAGLIRAAVESVAENTSDATVGPLVWGVLAGLPGIAAYRAINTLDAMVGHRDVRYTRFGWAAARLDDVANLLPARLTAGLAVVLGGAPVRAWSAWRRDAGGHPSPNAGVVEASFAGALGIRLGGRTVYRHAIERRPTMGAGAAPDLADLRAAIRLSRRVQAGAVTVGVGVLAVRFAAWSISRRSAC